MKLSLPINPVEIVSGLLKHMSESKKNQIQITWQTAISLVAISILFGTIDIRRYVDNLKELPAALTEIKKCREDIDDIRKILIRNKLVIHEEIETETATASRE